jgi:UDP-N-acetylglucosamine 2-epimerase (non-hydrolysing)
LTDSGGIQEETTVLGVPCVTLRDNTERPVTVTQGTNVVVGTSTRKIVQAATRKLRESVRPRKPKFWDGKAGKRIVAILRNARSAGRR